MTAKPHWLLPLIALLLTACSGNSVVGKWTIDSKATLAFLEPMLQEQLKAIPAEQREAMRSMMTSQIDKMHAHFELKADNSVMMHAEMPGGAHEDTVGTWSLAGDQLTLKTKKKDGKSEEVKTGTLKGSTIEFAETMGPQKMTMVFKKS